MTDSDAMMLARSTIGNAEPSTHEEWLELQRRVNEIAAEAPHPKAVLANVGQALLWAKPTA